MDIIYNRKRITFEEISERWTHFDFPKKFNIEKHYEDSFGIITSRDYTTEEVLIKAYGNKADYLRTLPLHHSQREIEVEFRTEIAEIVKAQNFYYNQ